MTVQYLSSTLKSQHLKGFRDSILRKIFKIRYNKKKESTSILNIFIVIILY